MNIRQYRERLAKHDWYYSSSDDGRIYDAGLAEEKALKSMMHGKKTYRKAYETQFNKHFKNKKWEREKIPDLRENHGRK